LGLNAGLITSIRYEQISISGAATLRLGLAAAEVLVTSLSEKLNFPGIFLLRMGDGVFSLTF
jgi:hypothetical protein